MIVKPVAGGGIVKSTECRIRYPSGGCSWDLETLQFFSVAETDKWCTVLG
jgi:hypothetical protein